MKGDNEKTNADGRRVLVVGAGGFAGGFLVEEGLRRGYEVWAGVRTSTSRKWLTDPRIHFVEFDFDKPESLPEAMKNAIPEGKWDYIIYNLGATKVNRYADFSRINYDYLRAFTGALHQADMVPEKFLYMSSLSAMGPGQAKGYLPFTEEMIPQPNTRYGASKLKAEMWLHTAQVPFIIFRATGIYGPRDHDYFLMFESIKKGFDFSVGFRRQQLTFLYVEDLARAAYDALEKAPVGETYIVAEPKAYSQAEFRRLAMRAMKKKLVVPMKLPMWIVAAVSAVCEKWGVATGKPSTLNKDKFRIMKQRNWNCSVEKARRDFGFAPRVELPEGVERSVEWYRKEGWL